MTTGDKLHHPMHVRNLKPLSKENLSTKILTNGVISFLIIKLKNNGTRPSNPEIMHNLM